MSEAKPTYETADAATQLNEAIDRVLNAHNSERKTDARRQYRQAAQRLETARLAAARQEPNPA